MTSAEQAKLDAMMEAFEAYVSSSGMIESLTKDLLEKIGKSVTGATRQEILDMARNQAADMVKNITAQMRERMRDVIAQGLEDQIGVDGIARKLREGLTLTDSGLAQLDSYRQELIDKGIPPDSEEFAKKMLDKEAELVRDRAKLIAHTEAANAVEGGERAVALKRGVTHKGALTVSDGRVCDECAANEAAGMIPVDQAFPSGEQTANTHPRCRCTTFYATITDEADRDYYDKFMADQQKSTAELRSAGDTNE